MGFCTTHVQISAEPKTLNEILLNFSGALLLFSFVISNISSVTFSSQPLWILGLFFSVRLPGSVRFSPSVIWSESWILLVTSGICMVHIVCCLYLRNHSSLQPLVKYLWRRVPYILYCFSFSFYDGMIAVNNLGAEVEICLFLVFVWTLNK